MLIIFGVIFVIIGAVLFFIQKHQKNKAYSLRVAKPATVVELEKMAKTIAQEIGGGSWREYVKLNGVIECDRPLVSELKQEPCVYYSMQVRREYEERVTKTDSDGKSYEDTERGSEVISSNQQSVPFFLKDQTGRIEINPEDADIQTIKVLDEFRSEQGIGGLISFGGFSFAVGSGGGRRTLGYHYSESILPLHRKALVLGTVSDNSSLTIQKPDEPDKHFIISLKADEELTKAADNHAKYAFYGMIGSSILGIVLILIGLVAG